MIKQPNFQSVPVGDWADKPLVIVGAGSSLSGFNFARLNRPDIRVMAIKETVFDLPFAEVVMGMDHGWIHKRNFALRNQKVPVVLAFPREDNPSYPVLEEFTYIRREDNKHTISNDPAILNIGGSSGSAAFAYQYLRAPREVLLMGFDYCSAPGTNSPREGNHYNDAAYPWFTSYNKMQWPSWAGWYDSVAPEVLRKQAIYNASRYSLIKSFAFSTFEDFLMRVGLPSAYLKTISPTIIPAAVAS